MMKMGIEDTKVQFTCPRSKILDLSGMAKIRSLH